MTFTLLFLIWVAALLVAWIGTRVLTIGLFAAALAFSLALFLHHATDRLTLSF